MDKKEVSEEWMGIPFKQTANLSFMPGGYFHFFFVAHSEIYFNEIKF